VRQLATKRLDERGTERVTGGFARD
jgi:hypothetical protein